MKPIPFPQANCHLQAPYGMEGDCETLHVCRTQTTVEGGTGQNYTSQISLWKPSWRERFQILWRGEIWLYVMGYAHPPVGLAAISPWEKKLNDRLKELLGKVGWLRRWRTRREIRALVREEMRKS